MSIETIYKCDHCGTRCSGDERATIAEWKEPTTITFGKAVHGCSKEHLGIALAKMFGIGVNGKADELLNRKQRELTKLTDANNFLVTERDNMRARLAELEARMPANEVTNAEREALNKACLDAVSAAASAEHRLDLAKERIVELEKQRDDGVTGDPQPANSDTTGVEPDWIVERVRSAIKSSYEDLELLKGLLMVRCSPGSTLWP